MKNLLDFGLSNGSWKKGASIRRLKLELAQKGIDNATIESLVKENIRSDDEELRKIIAKKRYRYSDQQKFMQYLARQGFLTTTLRRLLKTQKINQLL